MLNKTMTINGIEVEVEDSCKVVDELGCITKFVLKDMFYHDTPIRDNAHIQYGDFEYNGVCVFHKNMIIIRYM